MEEPPPQEKQLNTVLPFFGTSFRSSSRHFHGNLWSVEFKAASRTFVREFLISKLPLVIPLIASRIVRILPYREQVCHLILTETGQGYVKILSLQAFNLNPQKFLIPSGVHSHTVVRQDIRFFLGFTQMVRQHAWNFFHPFLLRRQNTP